MFLIHFHGLYKIFPAASAASKQAKTFFQHHTGVDRDRVFGHTEKRDCSFRMNHVNDLIDRFLRGITAHTFESMVYLKICRYIPYQISFIRKGKTAQLLFVRTEYDQLGIRIHIPEEKGSDIAQVTVTPDAQHISSGMGEAVKAAKCLYADCHNLCESRHGPVDIRRKTEHTVSVQSHIILHEAVKSAGAEFGTAQIILSDDLIFFHRGVRYHDDQFSRLELSQRVVNHIADSFVYQCHRQLLCQNLCRTASLIIALVRMADRQVCRTDNHLLSVQINIIKGHLKSAGSDQPVYCI